MGVSSLLCFLPYGAWTADLIENGAQVYCLTFLDNDEMSTVWKQVAMIGSYAVMTKWTFFVASLVILAKQLIFKGVKTQDKMT